MFPEENKIIYYDYGFLEREMNFTVDLDTPISIIEEFIDSMSIRSEDDDILGEVDSKAFEDCMLNLT